MKLNELLEKSKIEIRKKSGESTSPGASGPVAFGGGVEDLEAVLSVIKKINTSLVLADVLSLVVDHAIRITHADRGFLMLADETGKLQYVVGHDKMGNVIHPGHFQVSQSVAEDVFTTGESVCIEDALNDERFEQRQSIVNLELQTIMCAPLQTHDDIIGVIYVDSRFLQAVHRDDILRLFEILAGQAAIAIQNARLYEDLKKTYEELREANEQIIKSERLALRGEMAAEVSHELKNILNIALLQAQGLQKTMKRGELESSEKFAKDLVESIRKINNFSENLLVRSSLNPQFFEVDLNEVVKEFASFIKYLGKFKDGKIQLDLEDDPPPILADVEQIQQVLLNLANNAIEAYQKATITITTKYDFAGNQIQLIVGDDGPGLDPRLKDKIFLEKITTKPNGHGFGLPVCRKIIQSHKGDIRADSRPEDGTKFIITFPVAT